MKDDKQFTEDALSHLSRIEPSAELRRLVAEIPLRHPRASRSFWPFANLWLPTLSMAAVALLGLFVGRGLPGPEHVVSSTEYLSSDGADFNEIAFTSERGSSEGLEGELTESDAELDELLILATAGNFAADDWDLSRWRDDEPEEGTF